MDATRLRSRHIHLRSIALGALATVVAYIAIAPAIGLTWPYPLRLPGRTHFAGHWYERTGGCTQTLGPGRVRPVGRMWTALGVIGRPTLFATAASAAADTPATVAVRDGGCYVSYSIANAPGP